MSSSAHDRVSLEVPTAVTVPDLLVEARHLIDGAEEKGIHLRLLGGLAIRETCPSAALPALSRTYPDIDLVGGKDQGTAIRAQLTSSGYQGDQRFNALHGETRLLFYHQTGAWQIDVFLGAFSMCHRIDLSRSLLPGQRTVPLADLLLTKLQIVEMNLKDMKDLVTILLDHAPGHEPGPGVIDLGRLTAATSTDWGLHTTVMDSLARVRGAATELVSGDVLRQIEARISTIAEAMEVAPKSLRWKLRSRIGRRALWYELPDEVAR